MCFLSVENGNPIAVPEPGRLSPLKAHPSYCRDTHGFRLVWARSGIAPVNVKKC